MKMLKTMYKLLVLIPIVFTLFSAIVYTKEYLGKDGFSGPIKVFLDEDITISVLMFIIIIMIILWIISGMAYFIDKKVENIVREKDSYKEKYESLYSEFKDNLNNKKLDINVLKRIKLILPINSMIDFTRDSDLGNKFLFQYVEMMNEFLSKENHPEYSFQDNQLDQLRVSLINALKELNSILAKYSERVGQSEFFRIRRSLKSDKPELYAKILRESNESATKAWVLYNDLINLGRKFLGE